MDTTHPPTLLLVDDDEYILSALRRLLRNESYRLLTGNDPVRALDMLDALHRDGDSVDVVLSDQRMPTMSGVEFLHRVKERYPDTVRLVLSGYTDLQSVTDAINEGAIYKFLTKPWDEENLKANLREAFQRRAIQNENSRLNRELAETNARLTATIAELNHLIKEKQLQNRVIETALDTTQEVIQLIPWPILGIDENGMIALANQAAETRLGNNDALLGMPALERLPDALTRVLRDPAGSTDGIQVNNDNYRIVFRTMGTHSHAHGKLLALIPKEAP